MSLRIGFFKQPSNPQTNAQKLNMYGLYKQASAISACDTNAMRFYIFFE